MSSVVAEVLTHCGAGVRRQELHGSRIGRSSLDHDGVIHRAEILKRLDHLGHRRSLLADRYVNADYVFALLVDDRVDCNRSLAGLTIADDQLALATTDRHHRIQRFETCLQWLFNGLPVDHSGSDTFNRIVGLSNNWTSLVNRIAEHVHHTTDKRIADGHLHDATGPLHEIALADRLELTK